MSTVSPATSWSIRSHSKNKKHKRGQALIEYVLLVALVSTLTFGFVKFFSQGVLGDGINKLPDKVNACVSHARQRNLGDCR